MQYDYIVIGAGISGASAACELSRSGSVLVLEAESAPGYHATGRSAALYTPHFGPDVVRRISRASFAFLAHPKADFCSTALLSPRGLMTVAGPGQEELLNNISAQAFDANVIQTLSAEEAAAKAPLLRSDLVCGAVFEPGVMDIEVSTLHQAYLSLFKKRGGALMCNARVKSIKRSNELWNIETENTSVQGQIIINAAGAWADEIAQMADVEPVGIVPKRRTAIIVDAPVGVDVATLPAIDFAGGDPYIKPEAGKLMASPGDQSPVAPQDVHPEEWDIAVLADWLQNNTLIKVQRIEHSWAGLRSFVSDEVPVVGFDGEVSDFFWLAGQGGYGIMMAPALGCATASLIKHGELPENFTPLKIIKSDLSPNRFARR